MEEKEIFEKIKESNIQHIKFSIEDEIKWLFEKCNEEELKSLRSLIHDFKRTKEFHIKMEEIKEDKISDYFLLDDCPFLFFGATVYVPKYYPYRNADWIKFKVTMLDKIHIDTFDIWRELAEKLGVEYYDLIIRASTNGMFQYINEIMREKIHGEK